MALDTVTRGFDAVQRNTDALAHAGLPDILRLTEQPAEPIVPLSNAVVIWAEDNGAGKTRLMCKFATGVAQQIAIQP